MVGQKGIPASFGGVERHVEELSTRLASLGHEVIVYSRFWYTKSRAKEYHGVNVITLPSIHTKHLDAISHTFLAIFSAIHARVDVIHFHGVGPALLSWIPRLLHPRVKVVTTFHCVDRRHTKWGTLARLFLFLGEWCAITFAHETITVSRSLTRYCLERFHKVTRYIPNGISVHDYDFDDTVLEKFELVSGKYILAVARMIPHKGLHYLISAFQGLQLPYKLALVGDAYFPSDGSYVEHLKSLAAGNENIVFLGWQHGNELVNLYKGSALVVHPSESEGLPLVILESLSLGTPVLASDIAENCELVTEQQFLFRLNDVVDLRKKLSYLLQNTELVRESTALMQKRILNEYNWETIVPQVNALYNLFSSSESETS